MQISEIIFLKQNTIEAVPSNREITDWAIELIQLLYPEQKNQFFPSVQAVDQIFLSKESQLASILNRTKSCENCNNEEISKAFFESLGEIYRILNTDIDSILEGDPAAKTKFEIIRTYPGFLATCFYRIAHKLLELEIPLLPRILTEFAHSQTGIDIHPGAEIGESFFIDHGTGTVIGESSRIGNRVKLYQGVTLGALSVSKNMARTKRHPTIEDDVIIYSGATILGGSTIIGHDSIIGGNVWLTHSVPAYSKVYHVAGLQVSEI
jgi:serine O-acetyltransferase